MNEDNKEETVDVSITPVFNEPVAIATPKDAKSIEEISKELESVFGTGGSPLGALSGGSSI